MSEPKDLQQNVSEGAKNPWNRETTPVCVRTTFDVTPYGFSGREIAGIYGLEMAIKERKMAKLGRLFRRGFVTSEELTDSDEEKVYRGLSDIFSEAMTNDEEVKPIGQIIGSCYLVGLERFKVRLNLYFQRDIDRERVLRVLRGNIEVESVADSRGDGNYKTRDNGEIILGDPKDRDHLEKNRWKKIPRGSDETENEAAVRRIKEGPLLGRNGNSCFWRSSDGNVLVYEELEGSDTEGHKEKITTISWPEFEEKKREEGFQNLEQGESGETHDPKIETFWREE